MLGVQDEERHELLDGARLADALRWINPKRVAIGMPPFPVWDDEIEEHPQMILWRRAEALGRARRRR